jgi:hypothetical protein
MTATEAMIRAQEKGQLLAPTVGRQQSELLGTVITRELDILGAAGVLPPMPPRLAQAGGAVKAVYTNPLSRLRRADDGVAIMRTIQAIEPIAAVDPSVMDTFDFDAVTRELADINGVPAKVLRAVEAVQQIRAQRQQQQQQQAALESADTGAGAALKVAKAAEAAGMTAQPQPA